MAEIPVEVAFALPERQEVVALDVPLGTTAGEAVALADLPPPDLFIRTGGELRVSNFLLWQLAYTELWFTDTLWPEFNAATLQRAIDDYAARERRFGLTAEQLAASAQEPEEQRPA